MIDPIALAHALLRFDALTLRALALEASRFPAALSTLPPPATDDREEQAAAAGVAELLCERLSVPAPAWTASAPVLSPPRFVVAYAERMPRLRALCENEGPTALRRRGFYAPPDFLTSA